MDNDHAAAQAKLDDVLSYLHRQIEHHVQVRDRNIRTAVSDLAVGAVRDASRATHQADVADQVAQELAHVRNMARR